MRARILLWMILGLSLTGIVYADTGIDSQGFIYQGQKIYVNLLLITSSYDASINVTYPNGTNKVFIAKASIVGRTVYIFTDTNTVGSYRFHSYDTSLGQWQSDTYVDVISYSLLRSSINFVPSGMAFGVINKTFRHDWIISNPFNGVTLSSPSCKIYNISTLAFIKNTDSNIIYDNKLLSAFTNLTSSTFNAGRSYMTNCTLTVTYGSVSVVMNHMTQYVYVTRESQIKNELDTMYLLQRLQSNTTNKMFTNVNSTFLNTRTLLNRTTRLNTTLNQINVSVTTLKNNLTAISNITRTNQGLLLTIKTTVINIWNSIFKVNQTINKINSTLTSVNKTIVTNNTFIISQLRQDRASAIS